MPQKNQEKFIVADLEVSLVGETADKGIYRQALEQRKKVCTLLRFMRTQGAIY